MKRKWQILRLLNEKIAILTFLLDSRSQTAPTARVSDHSQAKNKEYWMIPLLRAAEGRKTGHLQRRDSSFWCPEWECDGKFCCPVLTDSLSRRRVAMGAFWTNCL